MICVLGEEEDCSFFMRLVRLMIPSLRFLARTIPISLQVVRIWDLNSSQEDIERDGRAVWMFCSNLLYITGLVSIDVFMRQILDLCFV